jgi:hypothetical protein
LVDNPENIIKCFQNKKVLEALALIVSWGGMARTKKYIYQKGHATIKQNLLSCFDLIYNQRNIEDSFKALRTNLSWTSIMISKCLHFLARSLSFDINPPVPLDGGVILKNVWPKFRSQIIDYPPPAPWLQYYEWSEYNRYMTAINCWAQMKKWTTTQIENTIYEEYK